MNSFFKKLILSVSLIAAVNTVQAWPFGLSFNFGSRRDGVSVGLNVPVPAPVYVRPAPIFFDPYYRPAPYYYDYACDWCYDAGYDYCDCPW